MQNALFRKAGDDNEQLWPMFFRHFTKEFGKADIIAHERRDGALAPTKRGRLGASSVIILFTARSKRPHLCVPGDEFAFGRKNQGFVARLLRFAPHWRAPDQIDSKM